MTYILLLVLILPCFAVSATLDSKHSSFGLETNGTTNVVPIQQDIRSPAESLADKCSVMAPINPLAIQNVTPKVRLYCDAAGVVWQTWENGECVHTGCIPMKYLVQQFGSRENASKAISCFPQYPSATVADHSGDGNLGHLSNPPVTCADDYIPFSTTPIWVIRDNRSLGDLPTKVTEISSADEFQVTMMLRFISGTDVLLSLDGGAPLVVGTTMYLSSVDSYYHAIDGGASTIYYYYRYQYTYFEYIWAGFVLEKGDLWYSAGMDRTGGFQGLPRPTCRNKTEPDDILALQFPGQWKTMDSTFMAEGYPVSEHVVANPSYLSEAAVTLSSHWNVFTGNLTLSLLSTLWDYGHDEYLYNLTSDVSTTTYWYGYNWAGDSGQSEGYVITWAPPRSDVGPNLHMSVFGWDSPLAVRLAVLSMSSVVFVISLVIIRRGVRHYRSAHLI